ncbi:MAG: GIY-YIG nuclease family protein, partial [Planctomycetia bacterium]|nr:GIY-YIG nuclease family protein [Planctomycetia bacterium]
RREREHTEGRGAKYTKPARRRPCHMLLTKAFATKHDAMSMEAKIKQFTRAEKEQLLRRYGVKQISYRNPERIDLLLDEEN